MYGTAPAQGEPVGSEATSIIVEHIHWRPIFDAGIIAFMETQPDTFRIRYVRSGRYEVQLQSAVTGVQTKPGFKDEAAARNWVAEHAPGAKEVIRIW
jgi:hypothetical protein